MASVEKRHCWECLRRRLVCDSARPVCNRCRTNGIVCPGYGEQQPLRWVKPGRVTARNRRRPKTVGSSRANNKKTPDSGSGNGDVDASANEAGRTATTAGDSSRDDGLIQGEAGALSFFSAMQPKIIDPIMRYDITCENFAGLQASYDYNVEIYERCSPLTILQGESRFRLPLASVAQYLPTPIKGLFILLAIGYQVHKMPRDVEENVRLQAQSAVAFWTCQVVRTLNEAIVEEKTCISDGTMTGALMLMLAEQQLQPSTRWRHHYSGLMKMARLRGGIEKILKDSPHMDSNILTWIVGEVFANTTSPSHDQLSVLTHPKNLNFLLAVWGGGVQSVYVGSICPPSLFSCVVRINYLRALAAQGTASSHPSSSSSSSSFSSTYPFLFLSPAASQDMSLDTEAQALLDLATSFSPETYAATHGTPATRDKWELVARVYQSAVVLYCIMSLQAHFLFTPSPSHPASLLSQTSRFHYDRLLLDLKDGMRHENFKNCFFWPLVVAGAAAVRGTAFERAFVADLLAESVPYTGTSMPLLARRVLRAFWDSGKQGWDDCFDRPYLFAM